MCLLFHKWGNWVQYERKYLSIPGIIAPKDIRGQLFETVKWRQMKTCLRCGKVKDEPIIDFF